ncbi:MAG: thiol reductant ABC exporter subunit CydD [Kineosporiaceae bacterium]
MSSPPATAPGTRVRPLDPRLLAHARAARGYVVLTAAVGLLTAVVVVASALLTARVVAAVAMDGAGWDDVRDDIVALAALVAARVGLTWVQERWAHRAATRVIAQLRHAVLARVASVGPAATDGDRGPALATLTTRGLDALEGYLVRYLPQLLLVSTVTPLVLGVIVWHDRIAAVTILITLPLVPLFMALIGMATQAQAQRRLRSMQRLGAQVLDLVAGLPTLRALGRERGQAVRVREAGEQYRRATMRTLRTAFLSALVLETLTTIAVAMVAVGIGLRLLGGGLDLRTGLAVLILTPEVYLPLRMVGLHFHASADGLAAASQAFEVLDAPAPQRGARPAPDLAGCDVLLDGVGVVHSGRARRTPDALTARITPGRVLALAGPSGCGKTTAVSVLLGLRSSQEGRVLAVPRGGTAEDPAAVDLREVDPATWWPQFAWVPQRPVLVPGTLLDNVLLGRSSPEASVLAQVATDSGLGEVLAGAPQGWATRIGTGGMGLSAGQRQRLGLARALLHPAAVVVLDEPTAHLDAATQELVHTTVTGLAARGAAVVLVAHRPELLALADEVVHVHAARLPAALEARAATVGVLA